MNPLIQQKRAIALFLIALACYPLSPTLLAVNPPPDGGYPNQNTAEGDDALFSLTTGDGNTAVGFEALFSDTIGFENTATGRFALNSNTTGSNNTASGAFALFNNTTGNSNTATGWVSLFNNTTGDTNTANGFVALFCNTTGSNNTGSGVFALAWNTIGNNNTANGSSALRENATGNNNTASGYQALSINSIGSRNTAMGVNALINNGSGNNNTANGYNALFHSTGSNNIALGFNAGSGLTAGSNNIDIGAEGLPGESNTIRIGKFGLQQSAFMQGISRSPITGASVVVNRNGRLGTVASSERFKDDIKPMDKLSEAIHALRPVTFHYKRELDPEGIPQFGLVAEDVQKVSPDLVVFDENGEVYSVRYEAVNAMLLNEFLKEHCKNEQHEATIARLQKQIEALTAGLQKVSAQLESSKPARQTVLNRSIKSSRVSEVLGNNR